MNRPQPQQPQPLQQHLYPQLQSQSHSGQSMVNIHADRRRDLVEQQQDEDDHRNVVVSPSTARSKSNPLVVPPLLEAEPKSVTTSGSENCSDTPESKKKSVKKPKGSGATAGSSGDVIATSKARPRKVATAAKRARRSEIEKQSRQRRMVGISFLVFSLRFGYQTIASCGYCCADTFVCLFGCDA